jgi:hypothetical protein
LESEPESNEVRELLAKALQCEGKNILKNTTVPGKLAGPREGLAK